MIKTNMTKAYMTKICDHTSVGMLIWKDGKLLLIERARFPFGFAAPAGHVDGDASYEVAAERELVEEVGLKISDLSKDSLKLIAEGKRENPCRREGGTWHYWKIYQAEIKIMLTDIDRSKDETKQAGWYTKDELKVLGKKTENYLAKNFTKKISENDWQSSPGLEPVWYEWLKELKVI
jgi:ADP-ribose pyrophosphatase YjhB (NUDIX family)